MAEQDKPTLVPAVLNDLIDVDGEPADGDMLIRQGGAWVPAAGPLPGAFGPALSFFTADYTGANLANDAAVKAAFVALSVIRDTQYDYVVPPSEPAIGTWQGLAIGARGLQRWFATEPGIYNAYILQTFTVSETPTAGAKGFFSAPMSSIASFTWGPDPIWAGLISPTQFSRAENLNLSISQGMIDAGAGGFDLKHPAYLTSGAERINSIYLEIVIERYSPGSTFDYYDQVTL